MFGSSHHYRKSLPRYTPATRAWISGGAVHRSSPTSGNRQNQPVSDASTPVRLRARQALNGVCSERTFEAPVIPGAGKVANCRSRPRSGTPAATRSPTGARHESAAGVSRSQEHPAYGALHRVGAGLVQRFLPLEVCCNGLEHGCGSEFRAGVVRRYY